ncbi:gluconokinase [Brenneria populi subsp. brevivirga]|uniref:gluconokinase n=1 Tax=Brenneria populi TaxID=1505588 RepID=UPI002E18FDFB|nr:gluconokinase [Brenneria populi subsp. brevivirga]
MAGKCVVIMGVSSTGKSSVGARLAQRLHAKFIDGDDLHPRRNIVKMSQGQALNDDDREPWLERLNDVIFSLQQKNETGLLVCSSLKKRYRDRLRESNHGITFLWLTGDYALVLERMRRRKGHFMPESLLKSQFMALEAPQEDEADVVAIDIDAPMEDVVQRCLNALTPERISIASPTP